MTANGWLQILLLLAAVVILMRPLGLYMAAVFEGRKTFLDPVIRPVEMLVYRLCGVKHEEEMNWREYGTAVMLFSFVSMLLTYAIQRLQHILPWNPQGLPGVEQALAWNTASSFTTNTNWQSYVPEATMSYFTQMVGLAYHNFLSGAVGIAVAIALLRGIARKQSSTIGNFWVDSTRSVLYILLPICLILAPVLIGQGVVQNLHPYTTAHTLENGTQTIAQGPIASQEAIKMLGTNGGGFLNANSAHPFENPTPFSNFLEILAMFLIPAALTVTLGRMAGSPGHGWAVFSCMLLLWLVSVFCIYAAETHAHPLLHGVDQQHTALQDGGNQEGKEIRFGQAGSALFAGTTTDISCGAVNGMHDSFTPLGGLVVLANIMLGEIVFGGVGSGLYGMLIYVVLAVFIAGLMVGRTPEYLGKKIEAFDVKMAMLYVLIFPLLILVLTAISVLAPQMGLSSLNNGGPHGLTEILYAFTSAAGNNGSAFAGLNANTHWYNIALGFTMLSGRFLMMVPMIALAGNLAQKKSVPPSPGTFPVNSSLFTILLTGVILIVGALTFFPVLSLGPILEHLLLKQGVLF
ncbi:potassium-transporting ATPase subunit KdpA [Silvibacterium dinghuense]|uniref:Potassium-transporting ATPase potassium-binding subunit n=1 Tax=Silvibacterium dinghuense TaxID=1560006 RepID=A0A4Q1SDT3_9BACT|nr:potassium-transporting ATPase subunit KdpA [Silvibacterium dinghuense]RXS95235.1 potassium-transporting ATPase subunit KdpA [Silvibacterium dinghuense]GGH11715.1 potassium-transporting ATPase potassium-binding subunit [Silvibacterium dinghuense]